MSDYYLSYAKYEDVLFEDADLNLGVRTETPQYELDVNGTVGCTDLVCSQFADLSNVSARSLEVVGAASFSNASTRGITACNVVASNVTASLAVTASNVSAQGLQVVGSASFSNASARGITACNITVASNVATNTISACNVSACNAVTVNTRLQLQNGARLAHAAHGTDVINSNGLVPWSLIQDKPNIPTPSNPTDPLAVAGVVLGAAGLATALGALFAGDGSLGQQLLDQLGKAFNKDYDPLDADDTDPQGQTMSNGVYPSWNSILNNPIASKDGSLDVAMQSNMYLVRGRSTIASISDTEVDLYGNPTKVPRNFSRLQGNLVSARPILQIGTSRDTLTIDRVNVTSCNNLFLNSNGLWCHGSNTIDARNNTVNASKLFVNGGNFRVAPNGAVVIRGFQVLDPETGAISQNGMPVLTGTGALRIGGHEIVSSDGWINTARLRNADAMNVQALMDGIHDVSTNYQYNYPSIMAWDAARGL